jgi:hypothetical protein
VWVGFSVYNQSLNIEVNPNAASYTTPISPTFNTDEITGITTRIEEGFSVSPEEFFLLTEQED